MSAINKTFIYMLVFTIISSSLAYLIILRGYETYFSDSYYVDFN